MVTYKLSVLSDIIKSMNETSPILTCLFCLTYKCHRLDVATDQVSNNLEKKTILYYSDILKTYTALFAVPYK